MPREYAVNEIFYSLQGEATFTGFPMVFVRLAGCNLHCDFCDTDFSIKERLTAAQILDRVAKLVGPAGGLYDRPANHQAQQYVGVCFTGGEPTLQIDDELLAPFLKAGYPLHLETNGTKAPHKPHLFRCVTVSPKTKMLDPEWKWILRNVMGCELKVVWDDTPGSPLQDILTDWASYAYRRKYLQPLCQDDGSTNVKAVIQYILQHPEWALSIQLHKILGLR